MHSEAISINIGTMDGSIWKQELKVKDKELEIFTTVIITLLYNSNSAEGSRIREEGYWMFCWLIPWSSRMSCLGTATFWWCG